MDAEAEHKKMLQAKCIESLDELIANCEKEVKLLKQYRQGLIQKFAEEEKS